MNNRNQI